MSLFIEAGVGQSTAGDHLGIGREAASRALTRLTRFQPSLVLVFASAELNLPDVNRGVRQVLGDCPLIGTSTAGEICNGLVMGGVVVALLASPHLRVRVGMGRRVSVDYRAAVHEALRQADALEYFLPEHPSHHLLSVSPSGGPGVSTNLLINFSPGATRLNPSLSHDIHTLLRRSSANRIPIFGASSGDYLRFEANWQMVDDQVAEDSIALAFIESDVLFGLGLAHGFSPTTKRALITRATGHIVHELDGRPAAEVCADIIGRRLEYLNSEAIWFSRYPFGTHDIYGNSILQVPERILEDGSIQFAPLMRTDQVITLMEGSEADIVQAGPAAYEQAVRQGGLSRPVVAFMFSCALRRRLVGDDEGREIEPILDRLKVPLAGFYTFGEQGLSDDGLPIYCNQSVSTLVFSDELNPVAALINKGRAEYQAFTAQLDKRATQIKALGRVTQAVQNGSEINDLFQLLIEELMTLLPWADGGFYRPADDSPVTYHLVTASAPGSFPDRIVGSDPGATFRPVWLDSHSHRFGLLLLKARDGHEPDEEDLVLAETVAKLTASGLYRMELDSKLEIKLNHLEILNELGHELSRPVGSHLQSKNILASIRRLLGLSSASLWLVDRKQRLLVKEAVNGDFERPGRDLPRQNDERLARWQIDHRQPLFVPDAMVGDLGIGFLTPFPFGFTSVPIVYKGQLRGVLNLFFDQSHQWARQPAHSPDSLGFLANVSAQVAIFMENLALQKHSTLYKEIHHRVKNNLHNVASLLRMQIRRLGKISAEQALDDSISRIMSIAVVHETLSQGEIGLVDLGQLVGRISKLSLSELPDGPIVSLDVSETSVMVSSRTATSLALVTNELIQNAVQHGAKEMAKGVISIRLNRTGDQVSLLVQDDGPGLPDEFDPESDGNLGMTIINTLVRDELKGQFRLEGDPEGTTAHITFPLPEGRELGGQGARPAG